MINPKNISCQRLNSRVPTESQDRESGLSSPACGWEDNHTGRSLSLLIYIVHKNGAVGEKQRG